MCYYLSKVESGARFKDYRGCIEWLEDDEAQDDLRANKNLSVYKGALFELLTN